MKKSVLAVMAAAMVFGAVIPAAAATFTSSNGVLSIELPDDNWKQIEDPAKWIALSDGANEITIDHFSNGEALPAVTVADEHCTDVYQGIFSTQNEVFMATGYIVDVTKAREIIDAISSVNILQFNTKLKLQQTAAAPSSSEFTLAKLDQTMYVNSDGLNVRSGCSTNDQVLGGLTYGTAVKVTGSVQRNGKDYGWYVIDYQGGAGYVSAQFLSKDEPAKKADSKKNTDLKFTGKVMTIYAMSGTALSIYQASDGQWYDSNGQKFTFIADDRLESEGGEAFTTYSTAGKNYFTGNSTTIYDKYGLALTIRESSDGFWYTDSGMRISWIDGDRLVSEYGDTYTATDYDDIDDDDYDYSDQEDELVQCEYCGEFIPQGVEFRNHMCPEKEAALAAERDDDDGYVDDPDDGYDATADNDADDFDDVDED